MRILKRVVVVFFAAFAVLIGAVGIAAYLADIPALIERYRPMLVEQLSSTLNRDVKLDRVEATFFPTLGVKLQGFHIADMEDPSGVQLPDFVEVDEAKVAVAVWPALTSFGQKIVVQEIRLVSPTIRLVRFEDGSMNFETLAQAKQPAEEAEPPTEVSAEASSEPVRLRPYLGRLRIIDGHFAFDDRTTPDKPIVIDNIGFRADDLGLGKPVEAHLELGLGSPEPNIELVLETGPLADELEKLGQPDLDEIRLSATNLRLGSLPVQLNAPFTGVELIQVGLSLVPSKEGYELTGQLGLENLVLGRGKLAFRIQPKLAASKSFDRFRFDGTRMNLGGLQLALQGGLSTTPALRWESVQLSTTRPFNPETVNRLGIMAPLPTGGVSVNLTSSGSVASAISKLGLRWADFEYAASGTELSGEVVSDLSVQGRLAAPSVKLAFDASTLAVSGAGFAKPAGMRTDLEAAVSVDESKAQINRFVLRLGDAVMAASGSYPLSKTGQGLVSIKLEPVALAPLLGQLGLSTASLPAGSLVSMDAAYSMDPSKSDSGAITLKSLDYRAGKSRFSASAEVRQLNPVNAVVRGQSPFLDLDALIPPNDGAAPPEETEPAEPSEGGLPPAVKQAVVRTELDVKRLVTQGIELKNVTVRLMLKGGVLRVEKTRVGVFGGQVVADGTKVDLGASPLRYDIKAGLNRIDGAEVFGTILGYKDSLSGRLDADLDIAGAGFAVADLEETLDGAFSLSLRNGKLSGVDLVGSTLGPLAQALQSNAQSTGLETRFSKLAGSFSIEDGKIVTTKPVDMQTSKGLIGLSGSVSIAGGLAMNGAYEVPASVVKSLTRGKFRPSSTTKLGFELGCQVTSPCIKGVGADDAAKGLLKGAAGGLVNSAAGKIGGKKGQAAAKVLGELIEDEEAVRKKAEQAAKAQAAKARAEAEAKAKAEAAKAKAEAERKAREQAEQAKKKAEEKAKKKLKGLFGR